MKRVLFVLMVAVLLTGCGGKPSPQPQTATKLLPPGATNVKELGNEWYTFELEVNGQKRNFLYHWWNGSHGEQGTCLTELK